jgi:hypothetical protein
MCQVGMCRVGIGQIGTECAALTAPPQLGYLLVSEGSNLSAVPFMQQRVLVGLARRGKHMCIA